MHKTVLAIAIEYEISGLGISEKTMIEGLVQGTTFRLGNKSLRNIKIEEIHHDYCVFSTENEISIYEADTEKKEEVNLDGNTYIKYQFNVPVNKEVNFESCMKPSSKKSLKITKVYEKMIQYYR